MVTILVFWSCIGVMYRPDPVMDDATGTGDHGRFRPEFFTA